MAANTILSGRAHARKFLAQEKNQNAAAVWDELRRFSHNPPDDSKFGENFCAGYTGTLWGWLLANSPLSVQEAGLERHADNLCGRSGGALDAAAWHSAAYELRGAAAKIRRAGRLLADAELGIL